MERTIFYIAFLCFINVMAFTQTVGKKVIPRDTSFTPYQSWIKIKNDYPEARICKAAVLTCDI